MLSSFFLGLFFFLFAFVVSICTIYICFKVVMRITKYDDIYLINNNNVSASLVLTSSFIAMAIMIKNALYPMNAVLQDFWFSAHKSVSEYLYLGSRALGYLTLTVLLSLASISAALIIFQKLTKELNEEALIKQNNVAVGLLLAGVLIAFAIMVESGISDFINALIPVRDLFDR